MNTRNRKSSTQGKITEKSLQRDIDVIRSEVVRLSVVVLDIIIKSKPEGVPESRLNAILDRGYFYDQVGVADMSNLKTGYYDQVKGRR